MSNKELKIIWKLAKIFWFSATIFWIIETVIFLIYEGWHYKATNSIEIHCDKIVSNMWGLALNLTIFCAIFLVININSKITK